MPLKPQSNSWSIPYPIGMQHCICNRREEGGITSHQSQVSSQSRGRMQAPNLAQELICLPHTSQAKGKPREGRNSSPWGSTGLVGSASTEEPLPQRELKAATPQRQQGTVITVT